MQTDPGLTTATTVMYILNLLLDFGSNIWRIVLIGEYSTNISDVTLALLWIIFALVCLLVIVDVFAIFFARIMLSEINIYQQDVSLKTTLFWQYEREKKESEILQATAIVLNQRSTQDSTISTQANAQMFDTTNIYQPSAPPHYYNGSTWK
jgi:hypothetical protein